MAKSLKGVKKALKHLLGSKPMSSKNHVPAEYKITDREGSVDEALSARRFKDSCERNEKNRKVEEERLLNKIKNPKVRIKKEKVKKSAPAPKKSKKRKGGGDEEE
jgi:ribosomal protein S21